MTTADDFRALLEEHSPGFTFTHTKSFDEFVRFVAYMSDQLGKIPPTRGELRAVWDAMTPGD